MAEDTLGNKESKNIITPSTDLHAVPPHIATAIGSKKRIPFRAWPRDRNGKPLPDLSRSNSSQVRGKEAPNGIRNWGATLYDFYHVEPSPDAPNRSVVASGSLTAASMRQIGELDAAIDELEWADREEDPRELSETDTQKLIEAHECRVHTGMYNHFSAVDEVRALAIASRDKQQPLGEKDVDVDLQSAAKEDSNVVASTPTDKRNGIASVLMQGRPVPSPFHPSHYPAPWPFVPFENPDPPILLRKRLPFHLLPETLYVHDPYNLLSVDRSSDYSDVLPTEWLEKQPKVFKYKLCLTTSVREDVSRARKESEEQKKRHILRVHGFSPTQADSTQDLFTYEITLPTKPPSLSRVDEAHLYLSPTARLGHGNHSVVYRAELELPRDLFVESTLCNTCVYEELEKELGALKRSGRWQKMLAEAGQRVPEGSNIDNSSDGGTGYETSVPLDPNEELIILQCTNSESKPSPQPPDLSPSGAGGDTPCAIRVDCPRIQWQSASDPSTLCKHRHSTAATPRTATFQVAAKLSQQYDPHVGAEARNYQKFPEHIFQNWSGYNLVPPLRNPVPVNAIVPQFYGYYVPEWDAIGLHAYPYLSPILLLEHCGTQLDPTALSLDDREECASLVLRFNHAGWLHDSVAKRNMLVQKVPASASTSTPKRELSFRLIDFGWSWEEYEGSSEFDHEGQRAQNMCKLNPWD